MFCLNKLIYGEAFEYLQIGIFIGFSQPLQYYLEHEMQQAPPSNVMLHE